MNKTLRTVLIALAAIVLLVGSFGSGFAAGHFLPLGTRSVPATITGSNQSGTPTDLQTLFSPFWQAWDIIHQQYVDKSVDDTKLMQGAINGMMQGLGDPHSIYMNPQDYADANALMTGSYAGIGAYVDTNGTYLTIIRPMPNSPAEKAGIQAGDQVIAIDGLDVTDMAPSLVRLKVLGPAGTTVKLTVQRVGQSQPLDIEITRANIDVPSVESKMLDNNIAYVKISTFGEKTSQELQDQLKQLLANNPKGLILDLRDNGGGYLDTGLAVGSQFISKGAVLYEQFSDGTKKAYNVIPGGLATDIPLIVLVNKYSASASEIVAGAIQDYGRGKLVGEKSYGKGTVQNWIELVDNQGAVAITIAKWLTPNGRNIDKIGLTPDVPVTMTDDDYKAGRDPQLDAAVQQLMNP